MASAHEEIVAYLAVKALEGIQEVSLLRDLCFHNSFQTSYSQELSRVPTHCTPLGTARDAFTLLWF